MSYKSYKPYTEKAGPLTTKRKGPRSCASLKGRSSKGRKLYQLTIFRDWCKACGICIAFCPKGVLGTDDQGAPVVERPQECIGCRFCELHCPDFAVTVKEIGRATEEGHRE